MIAQEPRASREFAWASARNQGHTSESCIVSASRSQYAEAGGVHVVTLRGVTQVAHCTPPALPVTPITPARENYHCLVLLEPDNGERNHAF